MPTFRQILNKLMVEKGISQKDLADATGIPAPTISRILNGIHQPGIDIVCKISDHLNVSTDYLLGRSALRSPAYKNDEKAMLLYKAYSLSTSRDKNIVDLILQDYLDDSDKHYFKR